MLIPATRVLDAMRTELRRLAPRLSDAATDGSTAMSFGHAIDLLATRERGGAAAIRAQFQDLARLLASLPKHPALESVSRDAAETAATGDLAALEARWIDTLRAFQDAMIALEPLEPAARLHIMDKLVAWEAADRQRQISNDGNDAAEGDTAITIERLTAYLRDRFGEPGLEVTSLQSLAGGFGKETTIFAAEGEALNGEFVIRRDLGDNVGLDTACHRIFREYPVIRGAFEQGFPAPDALWLDTEHALLPGADFIVMRRAPGRIAGNFFGAKTEIPADLADILADQMAALHSLRPMRELGDLTDTIKPELWDLSVRECAARYIRNWYDFFLREPHTPSPALIGLFGWLLANVPGGDEPPRLIHGDIGFHNFLLHDGGMSALVDWEFAHVGDPADDLGYLKVTVGASLDWPRFMARYRAAGGPDVDAGAIEYYGVWAYVRNACGANLLSTRLVTGRADDLKLTILPFMHVPPFIQGARALIDAFESGRAAAD
ncbi:phosphotransferase family protein [Rhizorhabdus argentea]|uniref:phosphotransferase family protein n=1 Tax=Rhizorhabdus argentea TaxID=1387174 RepID=UPI0030EF41B8